MSGIEQSIKTAPELLYRDLPFGEVPVKQEMKQFKLTDTYKTGENPQIILSSTTAFIDFTQSYFTYDLFANAANVTDKYFLDDSAHAIIEQYQCNLDDNQTYIDDIKDYNVLVPLTLDFASQDWNESIGQVIDGSTTGSEILYLPISGFTFASHASDATFVGPSSAMPFAIKRRNDYRSHVQYAADSTATTGNAYGMTAVNGTTGVAATTYRQAFRPLGFFRECQKFFPLFLSGKMIFSFKLEDDANRPFAWTGASNWSNMSATCTVVDYYTKNWTLNAKLIYYDGSVLDRLASARKSSAIPFLYNTWLHNSKTLSAIQNTEQHVDLPIPALSMRSFFVYLAGLNLLRVLWYQML